VGDRKIEKIGHLLERDGLLDLIRHQFDYRVDPVGIDRFFNYVWIGGVSIGGVFNRGIFFYPRVRDGLSVAIKYGPSKSSQCTDYQNK
jgi:hypothetical protein